MVTLANQECFPAAPFRVEKIDQDYFSWKDQLVGTSRLPTEDANVDGIKNLMAYANASESSTLQSDKSCARFIPVQERASAIDVSLSLEQSNNLKTWTKIWSDQQADANEVSATQSRDWGADLWDRYTVMLPSDPIYYRVKVRVRRVIAYNLALSLVWQRFPGFECSLGF